MRITPLLVSSLALLTPLAAQTTAAATIDASGTGCQNGGLLTGDVEASADIDVAYDAATGALTLTVENTTPIVAGEATAVITRICFNMPPEFDVTATLTGQSGAGGAAPMFSLQADTQLGCLGTFDYCLRNPNGAHRAIANADSPSISTPNAVLGPVEFQLQLDGPDRGSVTAAAIVASFSTDGPQSTNFGIKFQGAGVGGEESGFLGDGGECITAVYTSGPTEIGQSFDICVTGGYGCHVCLWISATPGPVMAAGFEIPIGLPLLAVYDLGDFGLNGAGNVLCLPVTVPNEPVLSGLTLYLTNVTYDATNVQAISASPAFELVIN